MKNNYKFLDNINFPSDLRKVSENDLDNSVESYQELLKLNNLIEKKFQKNLRSITEKTNKKIKEIKRK